jgi:excisionase family DNA binding protein
MRSAIKSAIDSMRASHAHGELTTVSSSRHVLWIPEVSYAIGGTHNQPNRRPAMESQRPSARGRRGWIGISSREEVARNVSSNELLSYDATQRRLGISRSTLYRLIADGELDRIRIRSSGRITLKSVDRYVDRQIQLAAIERVAR